MVADDTVLAAAVQKMAAGPPVELTREESAELRSVLESLNPQAPIIMFAWEVAAIWPDGPPRGDDVREGPYFDLDVLEAGWRCCVKCRHEVSAGYFHGCDR